ncbi:cupin-like domain-containing protein [Hahella aquimaris]|uniref:JmjC domain-containing protein n=1 Tax=Hahella chejuensis (strain KCTC 2396) TaxID=349521 RepID=Q2SIE0_HAHCH|nr:MULTISPECIES: cupin-like domain-containing protein [Hahella]ABC29584.1 conserved hypothetical protein [Hahella chejuensis KCTC 2396]WLQ16776.1 cupin-like domain-containing protein [Hahella sp. HNIBRBA332]
MEKLADVEACPVDRLDISQITPQLFHSEYRRKSRPLIITGALSDAKNWSLEFMCREVGDRKFPVRCYGPGHFNKPKSEWSKYCDYQEMKLSDYALQLTSDYARKNNHYMGQVAIGDTPLANVLRGALGNISERCDMQKATDMFLWLGPSGHTEPLHWDCGEGTVLMLHGAKKVVLFPPEQSENLYPFSLYGSPAAPWFSKVYVAKPDYDAYPKLREAMKHKIELVLRKGEVLFIPVYWWHELSSIGKDFYTCSVNRFWRVKPFSRLTSNKLGLALYLSQLGLMTVNGVIDGLRRPADVV